MRWPATADRGAIRSQYVHAIDVAATILDVTGTTMPAVLNGVPQEPLAGRSFAASLTDAAAPEHRETQYYEQFACRAIYHRGWKAVFHPMIGGLYTDVDDPNSPFEQDRWEQRRRGRAGGPGRALRRLQPLRALLLLSC